MNTNQTTSEMSLQDLMALGLNHLAYIKPIQLEGEDCFAVFAADGTQMAVFKAREMAEITIRRNDLEPLSVH